MNAHLLSDTTGTESHIRGTDMKVAIMQPYFMPYIGYFQLIASADLFIVYDNIKFTKKGWINRNRMLRNGTDATFSLQLRNDSDFLDVRERYLADSFNRDKFLNQFKEAYRRAPYFEQTFRLLEDVVRFPEMNLFDFLHNSIVKTCKHLGITTEIRKSSDVAIDHSLKSQDKVLALCEAVGAKTYINAIGGVELYSKETFEEKGIELQFIKSKTFVYPQFEHPFVPWLSIIDVMMFSTSPTIQTCINSNYEMV